MDLLFGSAEAWAVMLQLSASTAAWFWLQVGVVRLDGHASSIGGPKGPNYNHPEVDRMWGILYMYTSLGVLKRSSSIYSKMAVSKFWVLGIAVMIFGRYLVFENLYPLGGDWTILSIEFYTMWHYFFPSVTLAHIRPRYKFTAQGSDHLLTSHPKASHTPYERNSGFKTYAWCRV